MAKSKERLDAEANMTKKEILLNSWSYNKGYIIAAIVIGCMIIAMLNDTLNSVDYDLQIGLASPSYMAPVLIEDMENRLASVVGDLNEDGQVYVKIIHYQLDNRTTADPTVQMTEAARLSVDIMDMNNMIWIVDLPPDGWGQLNGLFLHNDNTPMVVGELIETENIGIPFTDVGMFDGIEYIEILENARFILVDSTLANIEHREKSDYFTFNETLYQTMQKSWGN